MQNPLIQLGSKESPLTTNSGLLTGEIFGKAFFSLSDNPKLRAHFKETISFIPKGVRCFLLIINSIHSCHNLKSTLLALRKGYFIKCGIITLFKSFTELTE